MTTNLFGEVTSTMIGGSTGSGTPGGAAFSVQYNSTSTFFGDIGFTYLGSGAVTVGSTAGLGSLAVYSASGLATTIQPSSATATWTLTLPSSPGTADFVLKTDGAGVTSWTSQSGGTVTGQALTSSNDTNVTLTLTGNASVALLSSVDMVVGWTGTLSSARLNANVVQTATNDTNVTATISSQNMTLGWTGTLAVSRGGTGSSNGVTPGGFVALSDGATVSLDASLGNLYFLAAAGNRTISAPSNPTGAQRIIIAHKASGAARTLTLSTASSGFRFGTDITALSVTGSSLTDYIGCIYSSAASFWDVVAYTKGF